MQFTYWVHEYLLDTFINTNKKDSIYTVKSNIQ